MQTAANDPERTDTGLSCLALLLSYHQIPATVDQLRHALGHGAPADDTDLVGMAKQLGAKAKLAVVEIDRIESLPLPAIGRDTDGAYFLLGAVREEDILLQRVGEAPTTLSKTQLAAIWSGRVVLVTTRSSSGALAKFDVTWFIPALVKNVGFHRCQPRAGKCEYGSRLTSESNEPGTGVQ